MPGLDYFTGAASTVELIPAQAASGNVVGDAFPTSGYTEALRISMSAALSAGGLADEAVELIQAQTATSTVTGDAVATDTYSGNLRVILDAGLATAGTTPTLIVTLETSADGVTSWTPLGTAFATVNDTTGAGIQEKTVAVSGSLGFIRAVATIGGTATPTFAFSVAFIGQIAAGSTPSLDVVIETSADGSTGWATMTGGTFTTVTDSTGAGVQSIAIDNGKSQGYIRANATVTAASGQAFSVAVLLTALPRV